MLMLTLVSHRRTPYPRIVLYLTLLPHAEHIIRGEEVQAKETDNERTVMRESIYLHRAYSPNLQEPVIPPALGSRLHFHSYLHLLPPPPPPLHPPFL